MFINVFLAHLSRRLKWVIVIAHRPSSVRPSSDRPSVNFHIFRLLLWNHWTEFNETWQEARSQCPLPSLCFSGRSEKQDGRPDLWLAETFSTSPLKPLNRIQRNLIGSKISKPFTKFVFFGLIGKTRWPPWPLIGWDIFDFSEESAERNSTKLDRKQALNAFYHVCVFRPIGKKQNGRPWPLIGWDIFDFSSETAERNSTKLDRKQDLNALYQVCFSGGSEKQYGRAGLWLAETYFDFSSKTAERNSTKLDWKQDLNVLYQVCVFRAEKWIKIATLANPSKKVAHFKTSSAQKVIATNRMHSNDLETCRMKCCCFWFHSEVNFWSVDCTQVSDSGPLVVNLCDIKVHFILFIWPSSIT